MISCIFTDNLNCRGMRRPMRSLKACLDHIRATFGTVKELTIVDGNDRILAFIPTRTTSGKLMVWDYRTNDFVDPKVLMKGGAVFASSVASAQMQEAFYREVLEDGASQPIPLKLAA